MNIDPVAGSRLAKTEFSLATSSLAAVAPQSAQIQFYTRLDDAIAAASVAATTPLACKNGCSYCCYFKVEVSAAEVLAIRTHVLNTFGSSEIKRTVEAARRNLQETKGMSRLEHLATNQACPFLRDGSCSVYAVRPAKCRSFHASDVDNCKFSFDNPHDLDALPSYIPEVFTAAHATSQGFKSAWDAAGYDPRTYDLNSAFVESMENGAAGKRLIERKRVFQKAAVA